MRKDEPITSLEIDSTGSIVKYPNNIERLDIAPLAYRGDQNWIKQWWNNRAIPKTRSGFIQKLFEKENIDTKQYLHKNLGLSLTDYYWVKPVGSRLTWKEVNLFDNDFKEDLFVELNESFATKGNLTLSPNSSLQGDIEKTWKIVNGERVLIKGNLDYSSEESINEVLASLIHKKQGYNNFVDYSLIKIRDRKYAYGCCCKAFTSQDKELVTAWDIISSSNSKGSKYEIFIDECLKHGMDEKQLYADLDYIFVTDYILSNRDRHMNNIGVLRDANTLEWIRLAPIYDSGKSMYVGMNVPTFKTDMINGEVNSFCNTELGMLKLVKNKEVVDVSKLPSETEVMDLYSKDSKISEERKNDLINLYRTKIEKVKKINK